MCVCVCYVCVDEHVNLMNVCVCHFFVVCVTLCVGVECELCLRVSLVRG